ncbi:MAG: hypothetical protein PHT12_05145 [Patescibacteria group bacterium]|nr:hypothetical protein [Patescibacteria group bacterium]
MSAKKMVKGLAMGAVLAGVAAALIAMKDERNKKKMAEVIKAAGDIKDRVAAHGKKVGKLSKSSYHKIVDTTMGEYRGLKQLSDSELNEVKAELKAGWDDLQKVMKASPCPPEKKPMLPKKIA